MKKNILGALIFCSLSVFSQEIKYGVKAGFNLSNLKGVCPYSLNEYSTSDNKPIVGFNLGGFVEYALNNKLSIQPELLFSMQGNTVEIHYAYYTSFYAGLYKTTFTQAPKLYYVNFPVILKCKVVDNLNIEFGPQIGFLLGATSKLEYKDNTTPSSTNSVTLNLLKDGIYHFFGETIQVKSDAKKIDFSLNIGASYDFSEKLFIQGRYNLGLTSVDENSINSIDFQSWDVKNSVFQISLGYRF
jgi:hypothetical protein